MYSKRLKHLFKLQNFAIILIIFQQTTADNLDSVLMCSYIERTTFIDHFQRLILITRVYS